MEPAELVIRVHLKHKDTIFKIVEEVRSSMSPESFWQLVQLQNQKEAYSA
jgi:hypothetical protein